MRGRNGRIRTKPSLIRISGDKIRFESGRLWVDQRRRKELWRAEVITSFSDRQDLKSEPSGGWGYRHESEPEQIRKRDKNRNKLEHGEDWLRNFEKKVFPDQENRIWVLVRGIGMTVSHRANYLFVQWR
jgi:hypothetical protein